MSSQQNEALLENPAHGQDPSAIPNVEIQEQVPSRTRPDWVGPVVLLVLDVLTWVGVYGIIGVLKGDEFYSGPVQLFLVELLQLAVICQAFFIIGGYDRRTEMRALTYTAEHILALIGAAL